MNKLLIYTFVLLSVLSCNRRPIEPDVNNIEVNYGGVDILEDNIFNTGKTLNGLIVYGYYVSDFYIDNDTVLELIGIKDVSKILMSSINPNDGFFNMSNTPFLFKYQNGVFIKNNSGSGLNISVYIEYIK